MAAVLFTLPKQRPLNNAGTTLPGAKAYFYAQGTTTPQNTYTDPDLTTPHSNPVVADGNGQFEPIYLDASLRYKLSLTNSSDVTIYTEDDFSPLSAASGVSVTDTGGYFDASNVETVLAEIGADFTKNENAEVITGAWVFSNDVSMGDNILDQPEIRDFAVTHNTVTQSPSGTLTLDMSTGNSFYHRLTANITTFNVDNPPASGNFGQITLFLQQDTGGGAYTADFSNENVLWAGAAAPTISTGNDAYDIITFQTYDGGSTYFGNYSQAFA